MKTIPLIATFFLLSFTCGQALQQQLQPTNQNNIEVREHFFDSIDFSDARILNTPTLANMFDFYTMRVLPLDKGILMKYTDLIINKAKANREVYEFVVRNRYDFFRSSAYTELAEIAAHIAEKHVVKDASNWTDKAFAFRMTEAVRIARLNPVGSRATNLKLQDPAGNHVSIDDIEAPYLVLFFYNPGCGLCSMVTPELGRIYRQYNKKGLQVFAIYVDHNHEEWISHIKWHNYTWIDGWDSDGGEKIYEKYDANAIPSIYLLDSNKTIILKDATIEQLSKKLKEIIQER